MSTELLATRRDATLILTLSNPGVKNALHPDLCAAAIEVLSTAERDDDVRAVVITGTDNYFCAGSSPHALQEMRVKSGNEHAGFLDNLQGWIEAIRECPKPIIAAVEGGADGGGFSLALACDLIVSGRSAGFFMTNPRTGLASEGGGIWLLNQALPRQLATEILIGLEPLSAARLHSLGVINWLVDDGAALDTALEIADRLAASSAIAIEQIKLLLGTVPQQSLDQYFNDEKQAFVESLLRHSA